jgi:hypothetical protein
MRSLVATGIVIGIGVVAPGAAEAQVRVFPVDPTGPAIAPVTVSAARRTAAERLWSDLALFFARGDASGNLADSAGAEDASSGPLRAGMYAEAGVASLSDPACRAQADASGGATAASAGGFTMRQRRIELVPHLTLVGFSRTGCVFDSVGGGGVAYTLPLKTNLSLVIAAGWMMMPQKNGRGPELPVTNQVRMDLVFRRPQGHWSAVGVSNRQVSFSGTF